MSFGLALVIKRVPAKNEKVGIGIWWIKSLGLLGIIRLPTPQTSFRPRRPENLPLAKYFRSYNKAQAG